MKNFKEVYEIGTDEYTKHVKKMTPGQNEGYEGEVTKILNKSGIVYSKLGNFSNENTLLKFPDKSSISLEDILKTRKLWEKRV